MQTRYFLTMALVPAAIVAHAAAPADYAAMLKTEGPAIEGLLKDFHPIEALAKVEPLLPAALPTFDKSSVDAGLRASIAFSDLTRLYLLAARCAVQSGDWDKGLDFFGRAEACSKLNYEGTGEVLAPVIKSWTDAMEQAKATIEKEGPRIAELKAKPGRTPEEEAELKIMRDKDAVFNSSKIASERDAAGKYLNSHKDRFKSLEAKACTPIEERDIKNFEVAQQNLVKGPAVIKQLQGNQDVIKGEWDICKARIEGTRKFMKVEADEFEKEIPAFKVKKGQDKKLAYLESMLNTKSNYESRTNPLDRMNFLFRLHHLVIGTPVESKVNETIERVRAGKDPLPEKKAAAPKASGTKGKRAK